MRQHPKHKTAKVKSFCGGVIASVFCFTAGSALAYETDSAKLQKTLKRLTLSAKVGQMIQAQIINLEDDTKLGRHPVRDLNLGSVLAGGDTIIADNTPAGWRTLFRRLQAEAAASSAGLPLLTGVDAVHGHGLVRGATLFPHNIGLGAARNPELMQRIGGAVAREVLATGFNWDFAPGVIVARDARWGRTYESFGEHPELQSLLVAPFVRGLQETPINGVSMVGSAKHFLGDGGATWGTGMPSFKTKEPQIDRGDARGELADLMALHGQGYREAIANGIDTVMASYSSVNGVRMHANKALLTDFLKSSVKDGGLGFNGFVISDWNAVDELDTPGVTEPLARYRAQIVESVNAGVDMIMVYGKLDLGGGREDPEFRHTRVHQLMLDAVASGQISEQRIDDAVMRILRVKARIGLLSDEGKTVSVTNDDANLDRYFGSSEHRDIARAAVRESQVLLKNEASALPITSEKYHVVCVAGSKADDFGTQAGAWTVGWQGSVGNGNKTPGAFTILEGITSAATQRGIKVVFSSDGKFSDPSCVAGEGALTLAVIGEKPYAEYYGDSNDLHLGADDLQLLANVHASKSSSSPLAVILISGRPLIITDLLPGWQALVAAWLPGSQGDGVADVLFAESNFRGRLPITWPRDMSQFPTGAHGAGLFPYSFGLSY
jgi:beta-glucosidase